MKHAPPQQTPEVRETADEWHHHTGDEGMPQKEHAPRVNTLVLTFVFIAIVLTLAGFGYAIGRVLSDQVTQFVDDAPGYIDDAEKWFNDNGIEVNFDELQDQFVQGGDAQRFAQNLASRAVDIGGRDPNINDVDWDLD